MPSYTPETRRRQARTPRRGILAIIVVIIGLIALGSWITKRNQSSASNLDTNSSAPSSSGSSTSTTSSTPNPSYSSSDLKQAVQKIVDANPDIIFGISFIDLNSSTKLDINGDKPFRAASTAKMLTATLFLRQVEQGKASLTQKMGSATAKYQLEQMINQSNNTSWELLNNFLTDAALQSYAQELGLKSYNNDTNKLSANDMATLLQKLYTGKLMNEEHTKLLLSYMQDTNEEELLPPGLPSSATFYHKYGALEDDLHDVAIVENGNAKYVLAIYTNGQGFYQYDQRASMMQKIVKAVNTTLKVPVN